MNTYLFYEYQILKIFLKEFSIFQMCDKHTPFRYISTNNKSIKQFKFLCFFFKNRAPISVSLYENEQREKQMSGEQFVLINFVVNNSVLNKP